MGLVTQWQTLSRQVKALGQISTAGLSHWHSRDYEAYEQFIGNLRAKTEEIAASPVANSLETGNNGQIRKLLHQIAAIWESPLDKDWQYVLKTLYNREKDLKLAQKEALKLEEVTNFLQQGVIDAKKRRESLQSDRFEYLERLNREAEALRKATNSHISALLSLAQQAKATLESCITLGDIEARAEVALAKTQQRSTVGPTLLHAMLPFQAANTPAPPNRQTVPTAPLVSLQLQPGTLYSLLSPLPAVPMALAEVLAETELLLQSFTLQSQTHSIESTVLRYFSEKYSDLTPLKAFLATIAAYEADPMAYISLLREAFHLHKPPYSPLNTALGLSKALVSVVKVMIRPAEADLWARTGGMIGIKDLLEVIYSLETYQNKAELVWKCKPESAEKEKYWRIVLLFSLKRANLEAFTLSKTIFSNSHLRLSIYSIQSSLKASIPSEILLSDEHLEQLLASSFPASTAVSQLELQRLLDLGWLYAESSESAYSLPFTAYYRVLH